MYDNILKTIVLPNVGYTRGKAITKKKYLKYTFPDSICRIVMNEFKMEVGEAMAIICEILYRISEFRGIMYKGKFHGELPNMWASKGAKGKRQCTGYRTCTIQKYLNSRPEGEMENFVIDIDFENEPDLREDDADDRYRIFEIIQRNRDLPIYIGDVRIDNDDYNESYLEEHRGNDHCSVRLPMDNIAHVTNPTCESLMKNFFYTKMHKWDCHYELLCGIVGRLMEKEIVLSCSYDHGS